MKKPGLILTAHTPGEHPGRFSAPNVVLFLWERACSRQGTVASKLAPTVSIPSAADSGRPETPPRRALLPGICRLLPVFVVLLVLSAGCRSPGSDSVSAVARFFIEKETAAGLTMTLPVSGTQVQVSPKPVITEYDIVNVEIAQVELGRCLLFRLTSAAARDLYRLSASNQGRRLVLVINDTPMGARRIDGPLEGGRIFLFVEYPDGALPLLVAELKAAAQTLHQAAAQQP